MKGKEVFNWAEYESILYKGLHEAVNRINKKHPNIQFYGMCIDCNAEYGQVLLHLNTESDIKEKNKEEFWDVGDWEYFDIIDDLQEKDNFFNKLWGKKEEYIAENMSEDEEGNSIESFMLMISKVANRLQTSDAIKQLNKTTNFRIVAADHDEDIEDGYERMLKLKNA